MYRVILKKSYNEFEFLFEDWNEACNFAGDAVEHGEDDLEVKMAKKIIIEEAE